MKDKKIDNFDLFSDGIKIRDLSSIPGKEPGDADYISDITNRAKTRLGISGSREGDPGALSNAGGTLMREFGISQRLSIGHERELDNLATSVIKKQFGPILDYYNIKLDIKISTGPDIRRFIDAGYAKKRDDEPTENQTPTVQARGADFSMLIHESVKGIWRVLSMHSVPEDEEIANAIESQFNLTDEPEDWKYGPELAADLRDFVNANPKAGNYPNVREEVWLYMTDEEKIPLDEFLRFIKGILAKTQDARDMMDAIIEEIVEKLKNRDKYFKELEEYQLKMKEYEKQMKEYGRSMAAAKNKPIETSPIEVSDPYSVMSQKELNAELAKALDTKDFETAKSISKYLE